MAHLINIIVFPKCQTLNLPLNLPLKLILIHTHKHGKLSDVLGAVKTASQHTLQKDLSVATIVVEKWAKQTIIPEIWLFLIKYINMLFFYTPFFIHLFYIPFFIYIIIFFKNLNYYYLMTHLVNIVLFTYHYASLYSHTNIQHYGHYYSRYRMLMGHFTEF